MDKFGNTIQILKDHKNQLEQMRKLFKSDIKLQKIQYMGTKILDLIIMKTIFLDQNGGFAQSQHVCENISKRHGIQKQLGIPAGLFKRLLCKLHIDGKWNLINDIEKELKPLFIRISETTAKMNYENKPKADNDKQKVESLDQKIQHYLATEVFHPKTELTQFCHQMKLQEPLYQKFQEGKAYKVKCCLLISQDKQQQYKDREYTEEAVSTNIKSAATEAARKLLFKLYWNNPSEWQKYRQLKIKRKIQT